jgi:hypothetical protein
VNLDLRVQEDVQSVARGDLGPGTDLRIVHELMLGPVFYRLLLSGPPLDRKLSESVADAVLDAFTPSPSATPRKKRDAPRPIAEASHRSPARRDSRQDRGSRTT